MKRTFYNFNEALEHPVEVTELAFLFNNSYHPYTTNFPDKRIGSLNNLQKLHISDFTEDEVTLPDELIELKYLTDLTLLGSNLKKIPDIIWKLEGLKSLSVEVSSFEGINWNISALKRLQSLSLKSDRSRMLPLDAFINGNLISLAIQSRSLQYIDDAFSSLVNLQYLTLHCEQLITFPKTVENIEHIRSINVYNRVMLSLNIDFKKLVNLEEFRWGQSNFFPTYLKNALNLKRVTFDVSYFNLIEDDSLRFENLTFLSISFSKLKRIPLGFSSLEKLVNLDLGDNSFEEISFDFSKLNNLRYLSFRRCENFDVIDIKKFIESLKTIKNLEYLETPSPFENQNDILKDYIFPFEWRYY